MKTVGFWAAGGAGGVAQACAQGQGQRPTSRSPQCAEPNPENALVSTSLSGSLHSSVSVTVCTVNVSKLYCTELQALHSRTVHSLLIH